MRVNQLLYSVSRKLENANIEDSRFEAKCLVQHFTGLSMTDLLLSDCEVDENIVLKLDEAAEKRIQNYPLQYILGEWEFMDYTFSVGEGVLIPRPETEVLVELALEKIKDKPNPVIFDLCSGSGCIAISIAKERPDARVYAFEKYDKAFSYLDKNIKMLSAKNVTAIQHDITLDFSHLNLEKPDIIVSNPPYICSKDMDTLQKEVKKEPATALDGGEDGLYFYHIIAEKWIPNINFGGFVMIECDPEQTEPISKIFSPFCTDTMIIKDLNNDPRIVCGNI